MFSKLKPTLVTIGITLVVLFVVRSFAPEGVKALFRV